MPPKIPQVAIIGRTNVGKSTLFNRLSETKKAIVSPIPGTTRDRKQEIIKWQGKEFILVDTGGPDVLEKELAPQIKKQIVIAIKKTNLILLVVDGQSELLPQDRQIARILRKIKKPIILGINKIDNPRIEERIAPEIFALGFPFQAIFSAANGSGTGDLLDLITKLLPKNLKPYTLNLKPIKLAIIGRPNVGKSSLLNALIGEERVIVSPIPHTTRDINDVEFSYKNKNFLIIDTVGLRRKRKVWGIIEREGVKQTIETIKKADVILVVLEVHRTISHQDKELIRLVREKKKPLALILNKWDLVTNKTAKTRNYYLHYFSQALPFLKNTPVLFVSALTGQNIKKILDLALDLYEINCRSR